MLMDLSLLSCGERRRELRMFDTFERAGWAGLPRIYPRATAVTDLFQVEKSNQIERLARAKPTTADVEHDGP